MESFEWVNEKPSAAAASPESHGELERNEGELGRLMNPRGESFGTSGGPSPTTLCNKWVPGGRRETMVQGGDYDGCK